MNEAEAEAALGALAESLEWQQYLRCTITEEVDRLLFKDDPRNIVENAQTSSGRYTIHIKRKHWIFRMFLVRYLSYSPCQVEFRPQEYKHRAAAKAACECHHATGKWG